MCIGTFCSICGISYDTLQLIVSCICDCIYAFQILTLIICIDIPFNLNALAFFVMILFITATPVGGCTQIRGEIYDFFCPGRESLKIRFKLQIGSILWRHLLIRLIIPPAQRSCWGVYWFHSVRPSVRLSVRPSVRPSRMPCPLCIIYSYGWILFILGTNDHYHERVCPAPWPMTLTYIFKVVRPWLRKSCPLCSVYSSGWILYIFGTNDHYH